MNRLGEFLITARGTESRADFARRLGLSYTFVREMEKGNRHPSDAVILRISRILGADPGEVALLAYTARSELLAGALARRGVITPMAPSPNPIAALPRSGNGGFSASPSG